MLFDLSKDQSDLFYTLRSECADKGVLGKDSYVLHPDELVLNISEGCNLTCPYCFAGQGKYGATGSSWMSPEIAYHAVQKAIKSYPSLTAIKLFGGEPFINLRAMKSACQAVEDASSGSNPRLSIGTVTNMTIFTPLHAQLIKQYQMKLTVSVDGPRRIHDHFRRFRNGKGSFDRIRHCLDLYAKEGIVPTAFESVYTPYDYQHGLSFGDIVNYLISDFDAQWVHVVPILGGFTEGEHEQELEFAQQVRKDARSFYAECVMSNQPAKKEMAQEVLVTICNPSCSTLWCGLGQRNITVAADGTIYPCYMLLNKRDQWRMANSIDDLHISNIPKNICKTLAHAKAINDSRCADCILREVCRGCPAGVCSVGKDFTGYDLVSCAFRFGSIEGVLDGWRAKMKQQVLHSLVA